VRQVVNELRGEKVDVVQYREDTRQFIAEALGPAKIKDVLIDEEEKVAEVIVGQHQLSLAIGKEGQNARLAARLSGYKIDIKSDEPEPEREPVAVAVAGVEAETDEPVAAPVETVEEEAVETAVAAEEAVAPSDDDVAVTAVDGAGEVDVAAGEEE
jgi:N utilization substance protein A